MSRFGELHEMESTELFAGVAAWPVHGERQSLAVIELAPGAVVPEHAHDNEQLGVLVSGSLTFRIGDETREVGAGGTWCIPSNVPHEVTAGPDGALAVESFAPGRADWAALPRRVGAPTWPGR